MPLLGDMSVRQWGEDEAGPPLVLVHGSGGSHLDWPGPLRRLSGRHVLSLDLPGHGASPPPGRDTVGGYAEAIAGLLEATIPSGSVMAGHSLGGAIALQLALSYSRMVRGLILVGTGARLRVHPDIAETITRDVAAAAELISSWEYSPTAPADLKRQTRDQLARTGPVVLAGDYQACNQFDVMAQLSRISVPTLVIVGLHDRMTPVKFSRHLAEAIPQAELAIVEDAGHMVPLEQPTAVRELIEGWLEKTYGIEKESARRSDGS